MQRAPQNSSAAICLTYKKHIYAALHITKAAAGTVYTRNELRLSQADEDKRTSAGLL
jgi:hypothetical protein